jgi:drug/metabolite transporter (DMT)-like permease
VTALAVTICLFCQLFLVSGQLLLKRGVNATPVRRGALAGGIALLAAWFFLWLGLLANWELSRLFPFEGLNPVLVALGARVFLHERLSPRGWAGIAMISVGVALVSAS